MFKLALIQHRCSADINKNRQHIETSIEAAAKENAQLILLQELHNTAYFCQKEDINNFDLAETIPGPSTDFFSRLAKKYKLIIVCSLFEKRTRGLYHNTAVVIESDGEIAGQYRKMHIPDDPAYYEKYYFTPGEQGFKPIQTSLGKLGIMICWDQWFPEAARLMALAGAEILLYPTAIGEDINETDSVQQQQLKAWQTIQKSHAIANGLYLACCNRSGIETDGNSCINFWGNSFICEPSGEIIKQASKNNNEIIYADIDLNKTEKSRREWPFLRDRCIHHYKNLTKRLID